MKLSDREKDRDMLTRLLAISDKSFSGIERPHMRFSEITSTTVTSSSIAR
jgi:hypothetical protein